MVTKRWYLILVILFITGCGPVISQDVLKDVDKGVPFQAILHNPDHLKGKRVMLGGKIIEATPLEGKTRVTVLQYPLSFRDKPSVDS